MKSALIILNINSCNVSNTSSLYLVLFFFFFFFFVVVFFFFFLIFTHLDPIFVVVIKMLVMPEF